MINPKKKIKAEMLENLNENLSFDLSQLESNNKRGFSKYRVKKIIRNTVIGTLCSCILIIVIVPILLFPSNVKSYPDTFKVTACG